MCTLVLEVRILITRVISFHVLLSVLTQVSSHSTDFHRYGKQEVLDFFDGNYGGVPKNVVLWL